MPDEEPPYPAKSRKPYSASERRFFHRLNERQWEAARERSLPCSAAVLAASYWVFGRGGTKLTRYWKGVIMMGCTGAAFAVSHYKTLQQDPVYTKLVKQMVLERLIYVLKKNNQTEDSEKIVKLLKSMNPNGKRDVGLKELVDRWMKERERKAQNYELWRCGKFGAYKDWWTLPKWCNGLVKEVDMASVSKEEKQILKEGKKRAFREFSVPLILLFILVSYFSRNKTMLTTSTPPAVRSTAFKIVGAFVDIILGYYIGQHVYIRKSDSLERFIEVAPNGVIATTMIGSKDKESKIEDPDEQAELEGDVEDEDGWILPGGATRADLLKLITV